MIYKGETKIILAHDLHLADHGDIEAKKRIEESLKDNSNCAKPEDISIQSRYN